MLVVEGTTHIVRYVNAAFLNLAGANRSDLIGRPFAMAVPEGEVNGCIALLNRVYQSGEPESLTEQKHGDDSPFYWSYMVWAIRGGDEQIEERPVGVMIQVTDATDNAMFRSRAAAMNEALVLLAVRQDEMTEKAEELNRRLEASLQLKSHFIAVLSHELRTPLTPVLLAASMLQNDPRLAPDMQPIVQMIERNVTQEARLIDDLLDMTRLERGKLNLERRPLDVRGLLERSVELVLADIEAGGLTLATDTGDEPLIVDGDLGRLQQVFSNLLRNAIKFTPSGGRVAVRCCREDDSCRVEVSDSGMGMDPEFLPRAFNAFEQGDRSRTSRAGLGLGLAICKTIVELHGGAITARSAGKNRGATFVTLLPILPGAPQASIEADCAAPDEPRSIRPLRILLVEDHDDTARILSRILTADGHAVQWACEVVAGLELAATHEFDLLLSDVGLPDGTGVDLMRTLRQRGSKLPGIVLSGYGLDQDVARSYEVGFAAHLVKPVNVGRLNEAMLAVVG